MDLYTFYDSFDSLDSMNNLKGTSVNLQIEKEIILLEKLTLLFRNFSKNPNGQLRVNTYTL